MILAALVVLAGISVRFSQSAQGAAVPSHSLQADWGNAPALPSGLSDSSPRTWCRPSVRTFQELPKQPSRPTGRGTSHRIAVQWCERSMGSSHGAPCKNDRVLGNVGRIDGATNTSLIQAERSRIRQMARQPTMPGTSFSGLVDSRRSRFARR